MDGDVEASLPPESFAPKSENNEEVSPIPINLIEHHPNMSYWSGILSLRLDYQSTNSPEIHTQLKTLTAILPSYTPWARLVKISIRVPGRCTIPTSTFSDLITYTQTIIHILNTFTEVKEVHMRILMEEWDPERLVLAATMYGLDCLPWILECEVEGWEEIRVLAPGCGLMGRLLGIWQGGFEEVGGRMGMVWVDGGGVDVEEGEEVSGTPRESVNLQAIKDTNPSEDFQELESNNTSMVEETPQNDETQENEGPVTSENIHLIESIESQMIGSGQPYSDPEPDRPRRDIIPFCLELFCFRRS